MTHLNLAPPTARPPVDALGMWRRVWWKIRREVWTGREAELHLILARPRGQNWMVS
jgi:hypothetical protein